MFILKSDDFCLLSCNKKITIRYIMSNQLRQLALSVSPNFFDQVNSENLIKLAEKTKNYALSKESATFSIRFNHSLLGYKVFSITSFLDIIARTDLITRGSLINTQLDGKLNDRFLSIDKFSYMVGSEIITDYFSFDEEEFIIGLNNYLQFSNLLKVMKFPTLSFKLVSVWDNILSLFVSSYIFKQDILCDAL